jgi:prophage antirepressor-like protein
MHDAYSATTFLRHTRPLRGILIDDQPWFVAYDLARLLGLNHPQSLARRMEPHEMRVVKLRHASGGEEPVEVISEAALYKALFRFGHPENRTLGRWLAETVIPLLRDQGRDDPRQPRRLLMNWCSQRVTVLDWQGALWVPLEQLPTFSAFATGIERRR